MYLSWLFLVSDSFFFPLFFFFSFLLLCINHSLTRSLPYCTNDEYLPYPYNSRPNPRHLSRYRRRNLRTRLRSDIGCSWLDLSLILSPPLILHPPPPPFHIHQSSLPKNKKEKKKKKANTIQSFLVFFSVSNRNRMRNNPTC